MRRPLTPFPKSDPQGKKSHPGLAWDWSVPVRPRTDSWRRCGWCPRTAPLIIDIKRCSGTRSLHLCRCKAPPKPTKLHDPAELLAQQAKSVLALLAPKVSFRLRLWGQAGQAPISPVERADSQGHATSPALGGPYSGISADYECSNSVLYRL